jgi:hypothetical protein
MPKKFLSVLAAILAMVMIFSACNNNSKPADDAKDTTTASTVQTKPSEPTDPTHNPDSNGPSKPETPEDPENPEDPEVPGELPEPEPYITPAQALYGSSSNGYGIWTASRGFPTAKRVCIDSKGYIVFEMDKSETDVAGVHNNAVLMKVNYDYYILRAVPSGDLLFSSANADGAKIILPANNGKDMFRDGYIMVMKSVSASYEIGFMNAKGEWIQPLSSDNPILRHFDSSLTVDALEKEVSYLGEGVIGMICSDNVYRYYDIEANSLTATTFPNNISKYTIYDALDYNVRFVDGVSDPVYMNNNNYLFYRDGTIQQFNVLWPYGIPRATMLGKPYFDRESKIAYFFYEYEDSILVADNTGKVIKKHDGIKLKEYNYLSADRTACRSFAADGLARIIIENSEGTCYYAVLNTQGEFLFEPVKLNENVNRVYDLEGYNIEVAATSDYGYFVVIDNDGTVCYESDYVNDFSVKNGVLHYMDENEDVYVNIQVPALY